MAYSPPGVPQVGDPMECERAREMLAVFVAGIPKPQGSKNTRLNRGRVVMWESSPGLYAWRGAIAAAVAGATPITGPVEVSIEFIMPRPKNQRTPKPMIQRPDVDKMARAVLDAITGVVIGDDAQVVCLHAVKRRANLNEPTGAHIIVTQSENT